MYARVLAEAVAAGRKVAPHVRFFIQYGSVDVKRFCEREGLVDAFERSGARILDPGCGACIGCGPGVSERGDEVTVSAINRNYTGRSGPGRLYLASPLTVAASAIEGRIVAYTPGMFRVRDTVPG
jgi:3-isopropylmalate/(R)-2-methylmalate dehydratase large subunit